MSSLALSVASLALVLSACGARVSPYLGAGGDGIGSSTQSTVAAATTSTAPTGTATTIGGSTGTTVVGQASGAQGGSGPTTTTTVAPSGFNYSPQAEAAACPNATGNTASGPGVTPSTLTFGNVSGLTGPLTGSFAQGSQGVEALFSAINADGGICGRKLDLNVEDDQQNSSTNESDVANLIPNVLAFVGSTSDADNGGVAEMTQANTPDIGFAINCDRSEEPVYWSPAAGSCYQPAGPNGPYYVNNGAFTLAKDGGFFPQKLAFLSYSIGESSDAAEEYEYVYQHMGGDVCYTDFSISPATASLESDVEQMQADGCTGTFDTMDVTGNAKLLDAMQQQDFKPEFIYATFDAYTPAMIAAAGQSAAQGLIIGLPFIPLSESQPMVQLYQSELASYEPGDQPSGFGFLAWIAGQMLIYALDTVGHNPTRANITAAFNSLKNYTAGGALGPYTPSTRSAGTCGVDVVISGNGFVPKYPTSGFDCNSQTVQASS